MSHKKRQLPKDRDPDKLRPDVNELAFRTVQAALGSVEKPIPPGPKDAVKNGLLSKPED